MKFFYNTLSYCYTSVMCGIFFLVWISLITGV